MSSLQSTPMEAKKARTFQLILANRVTLTVISVIYSKVLSYDHFITLNDLSLGFSKRPYLQRSIQMETQGELLKLYLFFPPHSLAKIHGINKTKKTIIRRARRRWWEALLYYYHGRCSRPSLLSARESVYT